MPHTRSRHILFIWLCLTLTILVFTTHTTPTITAQSNAYWEYNASGRVNKIDTADIDLDGIEELLLISGQTDFLILNADGNLRWQQNTAGEPIVQTALLNTLDTDGREIRQIVLGTRNQLLWYTAEGELTWATDLVSAPLHILPFDHDRDGRDSTLIASRNGRLQLYDSDTGQLIWNYVGDAEPPNLRNARPYLQVADFNEDGQKDIAFIYRSQRGFDRLVRISEHGVLVWGLTIQERVTTFVLTNFTDAHLAIGTEDGRVTLYNGRSGGQVWTRTPNRAITHITPIQAQEQAAIAVGTEAGTVTTYNRQGEQLWQSILTETANQSVEELLAVPDTTPPLSKQLAWLTVSLERDNTNTGSNTAPETLILDDDGRILWRNTTLYDNALTRLVDLNGDGHLELLQVSFSNLRLQNIDLNPIGQAYRAGWRSRINATPTMILPITNGPESQVAVAGDDGRIYLFGATSGVLLWQSDSLGLIEQIQYMANDEEGQPLLLVSYQNEQQAGMLNLFTLTGTPLWEQPQMRSAPLTAALFADLNNQAPTEIVLATEGGHIEALSLTGRTLWETDLSAQPQTVHLDRTISPPHLAVLTSNNRLIRVGHKGEVQSQYDLPAAVEQSHILASGAILLDLADGRLLTIDNQNSIINEQPHPHHTAWGLLAHNSNNTLPLLIDVAENQTGELVYRGSLFPTSPQNEPLALVGTSQGNIQVWTTEGRLLREFRLGSHVIDAISAPDLSSSENADEALIVATENGVIHRLNSDANRPPLLINPQVQLSDNQYGISIDVIETDGDTVTVTLLGYDQGVEEWRILGEQTAAQGNERLLWLVAPLPQVTHYRFSYDDGTFIGNINPTASLFPPPTNDTGRVLFVAIPLFLIIATILVSRTEFYRGRRRQRVYRQIIASPEDTLVNISAVYERIHRQPDLLLSFASRARKDKADLLARLLESLYLFTSQSDNGLRVLANVLTADTIDTLEWQDALIWQQTVEQSLSFSAISSLSELCALAPELDNLTGDTHPFSSEYQLLAPSFISLQEAERITHAPDRLAYFYETLILLEQAQTENRNRRPTIFRDVVYLLLGRWLGLVNIWIDDWRGRPWLSATLQTKRIVSNDLVPIVLALENSGQATAEQVQVIVQENPAFSVVNAEQLIPVIGSNRVHNVTIQISLHTTTPFRLMFTINYGDHQERRHTFDFADMVHLLDRAQPFQPIPNPYAPGTPLRQESKLFVGRESLLQDVVEQVRQQKQSILVVVGQRRTGKTSALLQLEKVMPDHILSVYVDGQSLGIVPGIGAFLHDIAWLISDALFTHDIEIDLPELEAWEKEPLHLFQRTFLPMVRRTLPPEGRILLIFDEFEVFESLVRDGIFPTTFFPFLRHLMQHSTELSFIFAGTHRLEEIASDYWSVLFNLALHRQVSYLSQEATIALITQPVDGYLLYDDLALDRIWRATAGHPYFLQLVCYTMVAYANQKQTQYITISDINASFKEMLQLGEVHFAYLWREATFVEQVFLTAVAHIHPPGEPIDLFPLAEQLRKYDFIFALADVRDAFRRLEQRGIVQEMRHSGRLLYTMRIDLVRLWVQENRSFGRLREEQGQQK